MGDTVNLAARLTARAAKGEILATGEVLQRARAAASRRAPRQFLMKGKAQAGHRLLASASVVAEGVEEAPCPLPLVGRDGGARAACARPSTPPGAPEPQPSSWSASAGIGKSRLVEELAGEALGFQVLRRTLRAVRGVDAVRAAPAAPAAARRDPPGRAPRDAAGAKLTRVRVRR